MKKRITLLITLIFMLLSIYFLQNRFSGLKTATRINTYVSQLGDSIEIVLGMDKSENLAIKLFVQNNESSNRIKYENSVERLNELYKSDTSFIFILNQEQISQMRKSFPRMSLIEIKNKKSMFGKDEVFFINKNKCNCGE